MWYVNVANKNSIKARSLRFYINYVVCKFGIGTFLPSVHISFILTMWYVNSFNLAFTKLIVLCFILTMWYVNASNTSFKEAVLKFYINYVVCKFICVCQN